MRMLFMGRKPTGARALEWSVRAGFEVVGVLTDAHLPASPVREVAARFRLPLYPSYEQASEAVAARELAFDVGVSFVYWRRVKEPLLSHPPHGIINFHPAPLPDCKGTAGYNVAILEALPRWAVTAHYMDENIDTGGIVDKFEFDIDPDEETAMSLEGKSQEFMLSLFKKTMKRVRREGTLVSRPNSGGRYIPRQEMEDMKIINYDDDVNDIDRKIRAFWFPPYTGAYVEIGQKKYTLVSEGLLQEIADMYHVLGSR